MLYKLYSMRYRNYIQKKNYILYITRSRFSIQHHVKVIFWIVLFDRFSKHLNALFQKEAYKIKRIFKKKNWILKPWFLHRPSITWLSTFGHLDRPIYFLYQQIKISLWSSKRYNRKSLAFKPRKVKFSFCSIILPF